jgi:hypothetical protein
VDAGGNGARLLTGLQRVRPFALQKTMLPAAAVAPTALVAIDRFFAGGRVQVRAQVLSSCAGCAALASGRLGPRYGGASRSSA